MIFKRCLKQIDKYIDEFKELSGSTSDPDDIIALGENLNLIYRRIKTLNAQLNDFCNARVSVHYYSDVKSKICSLSRFENINHSKIFLVESNPKISLDVLSRQDNGEDVIRRIVYDSRIELASSITQSRDLGVLLNTLMLHPLRNSCFEASNIVNKVSSKYSIKSQSLIISPGFKKNLNLPNDLRFHYFNIIVINGKKYIVDCSYRQFFLLANNCLDRLGIMHFTGISAGKAMLMDEKRKEVAMKILRDGYIEATEENIKAYLDGFAISFRNALFYEETNDFSYTTPYTALDYIHFFEGSDSQLDHESQDTLGFQLKLLKKPNMSFEKR